MKVARSLMLILAVAAGVLSADEKDTDLPRSKRSTFMKAKLIHSQKLLEALALEDFAQVGKHAQNLSLLTQEEAWTVLETPEYVRQSEEFRRTTDAATAAAKKKNLDGAALAFVEMTLKCVQCHKYVRNVHLATPDQVTPANPKK